MASIVQISTSSHGVIFEGDPLFPKAAEALASIRDELADEGSRPTQPAESSGESRQRAGSRSSATPTSGSTAPSR